MNSDDAQAIVGLLLIIMIVVVVIYMVWTAWDITVYDCDEREADLRNFLATDLETQEQNSPETIQKLNELKKDCGITIDADLIPDSELKEKMDIEVNT